MLSLRDFWRRHKRKILVTAGVIGSGYFLYKLHETNRTRLHDLEREFDDQRKIDELIKAQMQAHFENIQRIADTMTLPHVMYYLKGQIEDELDLSSLTERLVKGKGQPNTLTPSEKLELWDKLKILSFTRLAVSLWAMIMLTLYIRVLANILGRHLYVDAAHGPDYLLEDADVNMESQQKFLASADFLSIYALPSLISNMQGAAAEVLKGKQLRDLFNTRVLHDTITQILDLFMKSGGPHHWLVFLMPVDNTLYKVPSSGNVGGVHYDINRLDQFMVEARAVLSSNEFEHIVEQSIKKVIDTLVEDLKVQAGVGDLSAGVPLAKLLPRVALMSPRLLEEPSNNKFIQMIRNMQEVEVFFTLIYSDVQS
ncbi:Peroxin-3 [Dillenia turbinata]|uniref:Peroxin-3 n=1 Tax=Dillenia turbinata TaxID=194707 RepID=A0AAN8UE96_9MAGN